MSKTNILTKHFPEMEDGAIESTLEGVLLFQGHQHVRSRPMVYSPGLCIVIQGHKVGYLGGKKFTYDSDHYLVTSVTMPFECETFGTPKEPVRGLYINLDMGVLRELIGKVDIPLEQTKAADKTLPLGIGPAEMDNEMIDALCRLLKCIQSEIEVEILGKGIIREIMYRALCGTQAALLYSIATHNGTFSQVARALKVIQNDYADNLDVELLASSAHMSVSAFHRAFKEMTSDSPMQYLKKIRLTKARDMIVQDSLKAYAAADRVGYESASQFSREFKRHFGQTPAEMMRELRA